jgi:thiosulfate/3-mercaptopyruvate sulfurtransferase
MDKLVTTDWLSQHIDDSDLVVLDCTVSVRPDPTSDKGYRLVNGRADYNRGHIPGAGFADLEGNLSDPGSPWNCALPTPEAFCAAMGALGVGDDSRVVLYDANFTVWAARVWWMLRWVGFDNAAILDGGQRAWLAEGRTLSTERPTHPVRRLTPQVRAEIIAWQEDVAAALNDPDALIIDSLDAGSYRARHIPGAINIDTRTLLAPSGHFKLLEECLSQIGWLLAIGVNVEQWKKHAKDA